MNDWTVKDVDTGDEWHRDSRGEAQEAVEEFGSMRDLEIIPPNSKGGTDEQRTDGGSETVDPEIVDHSEDSQTTPDKNPNVTTGEMETSDSSGGYDLPDKPRVDQDPLTWMPDEFTDTVEGSVCINRKGFEVLCQHFGVSIKPEVEVSPNETDFEYAQCRAVATTEDGTEYVAYGSAHVDRGDDKGVLLEMADTRSYKRAASRATGVGMMAVEEIQNGVQG